MLQRRGRGRGQRREAEREAERGAERERGGEGRGGKVILDYTLSLRSAWATIRPPGR